MAASLVLLGFISMTAQAAYLREIVATFRGGELTIGAALLFWLLWTAAGSALPAGSASTNDHAARRFHALMPWYGLSGYLGILAIRHLHILVHLTPGELISFDLQLAAIALVFIPCNILGGYLFVLGAHTLGTGDQSPAGHAYILEASGAALGGIAVSLILAGRVPNHVIATVCPVLAIIAGACFKQRFSAMITLIALVIPVLLTTSMFFLSARLDAIRYRGQEFLAECDTRYGRLRVTLLGEVITFYDNASALFSVPDPERSEYTAHLPLLAATDRRRILILGGGPGGIIDEVLRWDEVERVVSVELDPALFELSDRWLDVGWRSDPRIETVAADGRAYLTDTTDTFDVIVMDIPPPLTGVANRYYTAEFFALAARRLSRDGVLSFAMTGAENYLPETLARVLASVRATLQTAFPAVAIFPGERCRFLAGRTPGMFDGLGWETFDDVRRVSGIETAYIRDYYLRYLLAPERMASFIAALDSTPVRDINRDTRPAVFVSRTVYEGELGGSRLIRLIQPFLDKQVAWGCAMLILAGMLIAALMPGRDAAARAVGVTVMSVGMTEISLEVLAILAYQSFFGLLYSRIALLTGLYMAGLAIGGYIGRRSTEQRRSGMRALAGIQIGIAILALVWIGLLAAISAGWNRPVISEAGFFLLTFAAGIAGGFQFPLADSLYRHYRKTAQTSTGHIYALDLAGSSAGAIATASFMIPLAGMESSLVFLSVLNIGVAGVLFIRRHTGINGRLAR